MKSKHENKMSRICMFVLNPCTNDTRVLKEAYTLGSAGYDVNIIALNSKEVPEDKEKKDKFTIYRIKAVKFRSLVEFLKNIYFKVSRQKEGNDINHSVNPEDEGPLHKRVICVVFTFIMSLLNKMSRMETYISYWVQAWRLAVRIDADIYHAHDLNTLLPAYLALRKSSAKLVYDSHELFIEIQTWNKIEKLFFKKLEQLFLKRTDLVITVNGSIADELQKRYKIDLPDVIINCPPPVTIRNNGDSPMILREAAAIPDDGKLILYQGGFSLHRGLEELIEAFTLLSEDYYLVFMGYGKITDKLKALANKKGLRQRVKFLPAVPLEDLLEYTSCADLGVIPYKPVSLNNYYTSPNKLFEYINASIPVAASGLPELRKVINSYNIGFLFDPYKPKSIASAIENIMLDKERYLEMKANTRAAAKVYNWDNESKKLLDCYSIL
jgi:glycosyltransferase involved in cell wall biosynthesis